MRIIVDTSIIIDYLRTKDLNSLYAKLITDNTLIVSLISIAELYSGKSIRKKEQKEIIEKIIDSLEVIIPDIKIAKNAGRLRAEYQLSLSDAFIAALTLDLDLPLATLDYSDFKKIKGLKLYSLSS